MRGGNSRKFNRQSAQRGIDEDEVRAWRVVAQADTGRGEGFAWFGCERLRGLKEFNRAGDGTNLFGGDGAGSVDDHRIPAGIENGGFDSVKRGAGVEDGVDAAVEVIEDVGGRGGADVAEDVGAGSGDGNAGLEDQLKGDGVGGHADSDEGAACGDCVGDGSGAGEEQR